MICRLLILHVNMFALRKICLFVFLVSPLYLLYGQQSSLNPISSWIFNPITYNPAVAGSKDFFSVDLIAASRENNNSQVISGNTRLSKKVPGYFTSPGYSRYTNFGLGGYIFNESSELSRTMGVSATGSYQVNLSESSLSFLSFGVSVKGIYNTMDSVSQVEPDLTGTASETFEPNMDVGIYYYGPTFYAGISSTNLLSSTSKSDSAELYIPEARQYFFMGGYKFILSRYLDIVLEPSLIISASDSTFQDITKNINPLIKLYIENFCIGTYFYDKTKISFFFQYNHPRFYIGAFFALPKESPYFKKEPTIEFSAGINLSYNKSRLHKRYHW